MKALCVIDSVSRLNGGLFEAERSLQRQLGSQPKCEVQVIGLRDRFSDGDLAEWAPLVPMVCAVQGPNAFGYSGEMTKALSESNADLAYGAGLWKFPTWAVLRWASKNVKPVIIAPHGMLDAWALRQSRAEKLVAGWLYQDRYLRKAICLRALCKSEAQAIRAFGLKNPVCLVPNGVEPPPVQKGHLTDKQRLLRDAKLNGKKVLLYLGRIHPKKGIANLLKAWKSARTFAASDWTLAIAGWDQGGHEDELRRQAADSGMADSVLFLGPQFKADKHACYHSCDAFVLPSFSEGLPMVILEAWSHRKPVLMTPECNLPEGFASEAAVRIQSEPNEILAGLKILFEMSEPDREKMGARGEKLVAERFTWPKVAAQMREVYTWAVGGGPQPSTVEIC